MTQSSAIALISVGLAAATILFIAMMAMRKRRTIDLWPISEELRREVSKYLLSVDPSLVKRVCVDLDLETFGRKRWQRIVFSLTFDGEDDEFDRIKALTKSGILEFLKTEKTLVRLEATKKTTQGEKRK